METDWAPVVAEALALGGILAGAAAWARATAGTAGPHLGVAAPAVVGAAVGLRLGGAVGAVFALLLGAGLGVLVHLQGSRRDTLSDLAFVGAAVAATGALVDVPFRWWVVTPPFGRPLMLEWGIAAGVGGLLVAVIVSRRGAWPVPGAVVAGAVLGIAGMVAVVGTDGVPLVAVPDAVGLPLRAAVAALVGRRDPLDAAGAGLGLGVAESLVASLDEAWRLAPTVVVLVLFLFVVVPRTTAAPERR